MNKIRAIQALNKKEIENGISPNASWHVDYRDTAYIYFGGLPYGLSEGDVITIFSQFGEPVFLKLARDKESGKSKGFGWLKYEDQRSTDLAVDNLGGAEIDGRLISVDHARYKARDDEDLDEFRVGWEDLMRKEGKAITDDEESSEEEVQRPMLPEEIELTKLLQDHDDDDPMKGFLIEEKKKEVEEARKRADRKDKKHRHKHHRSHRSRREGSDDGRRHRRSHRDKTPDDRDRDRHDEEYPDKSKRRHRDDSRERRRSLEEPEGRRRDDRERSHRRQDDEAEERHRRRRDDDDRHDKRSRRRSRSRSPRLRHE
ncbi:hypothetical protein S40288_04769 [Stachybotrys chartarum IBT 40288]|nr:hypothetical protein S40288_04769 [Stachybotrys chartarum IBT 40288]